jgi:Na+/melibiose symporter-like transporter
MQPILNGGTEMNELIKMYKLRLLALVIAAPILIIFFEILGIVLWVSLSNNDGWKYGLPIIIYGILLGILYFFCYKYMKNKLNKIQNEYNELSKVSERGEGASTKNA